MSDNKSSATSGFGCLGMIIAGTLSWIKWHSIAWLLLHAICSWAYVAYFVIAYTDLLLPHIK